MVKNLLLVGQISKLGQKLFFHSNNSYVYFYDFLTHCVISFLAIKVKVRYLVGYCNIGIQKQCKFILVVVGLVTI